METKSITTDEFFKLAKDLHGLDFKKGSDGGEMDEAVVCFCKQRHRFYYEKGNEPKCPYCLSMDLTKANDEIERLRNVR